MILNFSKECHLPGQLFIKAMNSGLFDSKTGPYPYGPFGHITLLSPTKEM